MAGSRSYLIALTLLFSIALPVVADEAKSDDQLKQLAERFAAAPVDAESPEPKKTAPATAPNIAVTLPQERLPLGKSARSGANAVGATTANPQDDDANATGGVGLLDTLTALGVVVVLILLLRSAIAKWSGRPLATPRTQAIEVLARVPVAPRNHVLLLQLGHRVLVVGDSAGGMRTLANIEDPEEISSLLSSVGSSRSNSISEGFSKLVDRFNTDFDESTELEGADNSEVVVDQTRDRVSGLVSRMRSLSKGDSA